jgi:hypothetical protein
MTPLWHHGTITPRAFKFFVENALKTNLSFDCVLKAYGGLGVCGKHWK